MAYKGICLRPSKDFERAGVKMPANLDVGFFVPKSENQIIEVGESAEFIITPSHGISISEKVFGNLRNLKVVQLTGTGYEKVDLIAATKNGVPVANTPGQNSRSVAQYVFIMIGVICRRLLEGNNKTKQGMFVEARKELITPTLHEFGELNLGIIGMGRIGRNVATIGKSFGYHIGYYDIVKLKPKIEDKFEARYLDLEELLQWADILTVHLPLNSTTKSFIGENEFKLMKPTTILINIARGGIVDEYALCKALSEGQIWGAGVDVFAEEPPPRDHPYFTLNKKLQDRLLLSPHMGGRTIESHRRTLSFAVENVKAFLLDGEPLKCIINLDANKES